MSRLRRLSSILSIAFLLCSAALLHAQAYTSIVVFGDSLSDTGNFARLSANAYGLPGRIPGPIANYTDGRFTDGMDTLPQALTYTGVWVEQLAATLAAKPPIKASLDGGTDYSYGSATNSPGTQVVTFGPGNSLTVTVKNVGQQIADYLATKPAITSKTLFVVWSGANDLLQATSQAAILTAANLDVANIQTLINAGATDFLIPNLPPLGAIPRLNTNPAASATATAGAQGYNAGIAAGIAALPAANAGKTLHLFSLDTFSLFNSVLASPSVFNFTNDTQSAQSSPLVNPDAYLFWDDLHPTTSGHHFIAVNAKNVLTATSTTTAALTLGAASAVPGQAITLTAVVTPTATGAPPAPTGYVTFYSGASPVATASLNSAGTATATLTAGPSSGSPYSITAQYSGDATYITSTAAAKTLAVLATPVATTTTLTSSNISSNIAAPVTFTATVASAAGTPIGTVTFLDGTATLGTATLAAGSATFTTSTLGAATHNITAVYAGNTTFATSTSAVLAQVVNAPLVTISATPPSVTVARGSTGTTTITLTPVGGVTGTYTLGCASFPAHLSCSYSTASLAFTGSNTAQTSTLTIGTTASAQLSSPQLPGRPAEIQILSATLLVPFFGGLAVVGRKRRPRRPLPLLTLLLILSAGAISGLTGCGSTPSNQTAPGTYQIIVNAASTTGPLAANLTLMVVVQ